MTCPFCKEQVADGATVCKHCRKEIGAAASVGNVMKALGAIVTLLVTVPIMIYLFTGYSVPSPVTGIATAVTGQADGVSLAQFESLRNGMSYTEAVAALGRSGTEQSRSDLANITTVMYTWSGAGGLGANMNAMFQNDKLVSKAQFGLR